MLRIVKVEIDRPIKSQYIASAHVTFSDGEGTTFRINHFCIGDRQGRLFATTPAVSIRTESGWTFKRLVEISDEFWRELSIRIVDEYERWATRHAGVR